MENSGYIRIVDTMADFFRTNALNSVEFDDGKVFANSSKAFRVSYNEQKKLVTLSVADVLENGLSQFSVLSSWIFDENSNEKDVRSISNDFEESIMSALGQKKTVDRRVDMPQANKDGDRTPEALAQKLLAVFPPLKNDYAEHIEKYNEFYYDEFFTEKVVPEICKFLDTSDKKKISKLVTMLDEMYVDGTPDTSATVAYTILGGVGAIDKKYQDILAPFIDECKYLKLVMPTVYKLAAKDYKKRK